MLPSQIEQERELFVETMQSESYLFTLDELEWEPKRNCFKHYRIHLAWRCWLDRALIAEDETRDAWSDGYQEGYDTGTSED